MTSELHENGALERRELLIPLRCIVEHHGLTLNQARMQMIVDSIKEGGLPFITLSYGEDSGDVFSIIHGFETVDALRTLQIHEVRTYTYGNVPAEELPDARIRAAYEHEDDVLRLIELMNRPGVRAVGEVT